MLLLKASVFHKHKLMCFVRYPDCFLGGLIPRHRREIIPAVSVNITGRCK